MKYKPYFFTGVFLLSFFFLKKSFPDSFDLLGFRSSEIEFPLAPQFLESFSRAILKINAFGWQGTGFFVTPTLLVTSAHVLLDNLLIKSETHFQESEIFGHIELTQNVPYQEKKFRLKRIVSLSLREDLALLEIEGETSFYLNLNIEEPLENLTHEPLYALGYPKGKFYIMKKTDPHYSYKSLFHVIPMNYINMGGASGSPVLDYQGYVVGVWHGWVKNTNLHHVLESTYLQAFVQGDYGTKCITTIKDCFKKDLIRIQLEQDLAYKGHQLRFISCTST